MNEVVYVYHYWLRKESSPWWRCADFKGWYVHERDFIDAAVESGVLGPDDRFSTGRNGTKKQLITNYLHVVKK